MVWSAKPKSPLFRTPRRMANKSQTPTSLWFTTPMYPNFSFNSSYNTFGLFSSLYMFPAKRRDVSWVPANHRGSDRGNMAGVWSPWQRIESCCAWHEAAIALIQREEKRLLYVYISTHICTLCFETRSTHGRISFCRTLGIFRSSASSGQAALSVHPYFPCSWLHQGTRTCSAKVRVREITSNWLPRNQLRWTLSIEVYWQNPAVLSLTSTHAKTKWVSLCGNQTSLNIV